MKHLLLILSVLICVAGFSQDRNPSGENTASRVQAYKIAYITKKLELSPEEAQKFWPMYNKYEEEMIKTRIKFRKENTSEIEKEQKLLEIKKDYSKEFIKIIGDKKTDDFFKAEKEFNTQVQRELLQRNQQRKKIN